MKIRRLERNLRRIVGPQAFLDDPASLAIYSYDSSLQSGMPDFVLFPQTTEQVSEVVRLLYREKIPYVARGAGTNLSGGSIALRGGAVIVLSRMRRILGIEPENFCAHVESGLTNLEFQRALAELGYFFAPDPASQRVSTLGGNFAENSGGPHCLKYGVTTNHILGAKIVAPDGDIMKVGGKTLDRPGYDLLGLLVGSEGTLGIVTEIFCRILPLPESTKTMLAVFDSVGEAGQAVSDIIAAGILPATLEMMDNIIIRAVEASLHAGYPVDAAAVLIIEIDGVSEGLDDVAVEIDRVCCLNGVREIRTARNEHERDQLWAGRRGAFGAVARLYPNYSVSDGTVPRTRLPEVLRRISEIGHEYQVEIGNVFHAGDGNLHPLVFFDLRDKEQLERVHQVGEEILKACAAVGGTITGEHGVGAEKINAMPLVFGANEMDLMRAIKASLDPANLCNPGKILPQRVPRETPLSNLTSDATESIIAPEVNHEETVTFSPSTPTEIGDIVRDLWKRNRGFGILGARTLFPYLPSQDDPGIFIETTNVREIIEHDAPNLTATVQAGLSLGELQEELLKAGQFLPIDASHSATLGGVMASGLSGLRRHLYGSLRDLVLGLAFIGANGEIFHAGGKTVKNVAGYDFGKLLIGSWGKLGIISEITFRLLPSPRTCEAILVGFERIDDAYAAAAIIASKLNPAVATVLNEEAVLWLEKELMFSGSSLPYTLILGAEGFPSAVEKQVSGFRHICGEQAGAVWGCVRDNDYRMLADAITRLCYGIRDRKPDINIFLGAPCAEVADILKQGEELATKHMITVYVVSHPASGAIYLQFSANESNGVMKCAGEILETIQCRFPNSHITVLGVRQELTGIVPFIACNCYPEPWLGAVKRCFDPQGIINPGIPPW